jgi:hypothetical protein
MSICIYIKLHAVSTIMFDVVNAVLVQMNKNYWQLSILKEMVIIILGYISF